MTATTPILYRAIDIAETLLARVMRKPKPQPALERMNEQAHDYYNLLTGRPDVPERLPSRFLEVPEEEVELAQKAGAQLVDGVWTVPKHLPEEQFEAWWPQVPADLRDKNANNLTTRNGDPIEAYFRTSDNQRGDDSTATTIVYGGLVILSAMGYFLATLHPALALLPVLLAAPLIVALAQGEGVMDAIRSTFLLLILPMSFATMAIKDSPFLAKFSLLTGIGEALKTGTVAPFILQRVYGIAAGMSTTFVVAIFAVALWTLLDSKKRQSTIGGNANTFRDFWVRLKANIKWAVATTVIMGVCLTVLPAPLKPFFFFLMASLYTLIHTEANYNTRTKELEALGKQFKMARLGALQGVHVAPKIEQAKAAIADKTPLIKIATATGWLSRQKYPNGPDEGLDMVMSALDSNSHLIVYGMIGIGKTSSVMRPVAKQWIENRAGGFLCLCGKGSLPGEISSLIDLMVRPGVDYAPFQGLDAQGVATALNSIQVDKKNEDGSIWDGGAKDFIDHLTVLHRALHDHERNTMRYASVVVREKEEAADYWMLEVAKLTKLGHDTSEASLKLAKIREQIEAWRVKQEQCAERVWLWNVDTLVRLRNIVNAIVVRGGGMSPGNELLEALNELGYNADPARIRTRPQSIHPEIGQGTLLDGTLEFFAKTWPATDEKQRSSFLINVDARLLPLTRGRYLVGKNGVHWKMLEEGEDVGICLFGKSVGVDLPETLHGRAGLAITTLVKQRVYDGTKLRAGRDEKEWLDEGQMPLMVMIDEGHLVIGDPEASLATISRSLRLSFVVATQTYENLIDRFGGDENAADKFDSTFQSFICMKSSPRTYRRIRERLGQADMIKFKQEAMAIDYQGALRNFALSPLNDPNHPNRAGMERLLRLGFGNPIVRIPAFQTRSGMSWGRAGVMDLDENTMQSEMVVPVGGKTETCDLFEEHEFKALLTKGQGIVSLLRAGHERVDLATFTEVKAHELRKALPDVRSLVAEPADA